MKEEDSKMKKKIAGIVCVIGIAISTVSNVYADAEVYNVG